jgi:hypothetical protein
MVSDGVSSFCSNEHRFAHKTSLRKEGAARAATRQRSKKVVDDLAPDLRQRVLERDGFRCCYCGRSSNNLALHHVIYRSEIRNRPWQDQPSNLITLCNMPCHLDIIHGNKQLYQPLCLKLIWLREVEGDPFTLIPHLLGDSNVS